MSKDRHFFWGMFLSFEHSVVIIFLSTTGSESSVTPTPSYTGARAHTLTHTHTHTHAHTHTHIHTHTRYEPKNIPSVNTILEFDKHCKPDMVGIDDKLVLPFSKQQLHGFA